MKCKIRCKLIAFLLGIYIPIFILIFYGYGEIKKEKKADILTRHQYIAKGVSKEIKTILDDSLMLLSALSQHPDVKSINVTKCDELFAKNITFCPYCLNILMADTKGNNVGSALFPEKAHKLNYLDKEWFNNGIKGKPAIDSPHISKLFKEKTFMITYPVFANERQVGVLGIPINLTKVSDRIISSYDLFKNTNIVLVNENGVIMLNRFYPDMVGKEIEKDNLWKKISSEKNGVWEEEGKDGIKKLFSFDTVTDYNWKVMVEIPEKIILEESFNHIKGDIIAAISLLILSILIALYFSRNLAKRFELLANGFLSFGQGNLSFRFTTDRVRDEFLNIFSTFNKMADNIEHYKSEIDKLNNIYSLLSEVNQKIVRYSDIQRLLNDICKDIVEIGGYRMCFIGKKELIKGEKVVTPVSYFGYEEGYLEKANIRWDDSERGSGQTGMAIKTGKVHIKRDIEKIDDVWKEEAIKRGYRSSAAIPIIIDDEVFGTLNVYSEYPDTFDDREINLLQELASDIGFAIKNIKIRQDKEETDKLLVGIFEGMGEGLALIDKDLKIITANKKCLEIVGKQREEVINNNYYKVFFDLSELCNFNGNPCDITSVFQDGKERTRVIKRKNKDGNILTFSMRFFPFIVDNEIKYVIKIIQDITEYKKLEAQYLHSQKLESIGRLTARIAHDFNNILTGILGFATLSQMEIKDEKLKKNLSNIIELSEKAGNLTKSLLAFSRKTESNPQVININEVLVGTEKILKRVIGEDITLELQLEPHILNVFADPLQLEQVIMNLVSNARDAMPKGGIIKIETSYVVLDKNFIKIHGYGREGAYVLLSVTDTGVGIPKDIMDKIFDPFFTTKPVGKGTGLGLSVVYGIIRNHDGYINVYSEVGKGTTFKIYLPIVKERESIESTKEDTNALKILNASVLLVEDDKVIGEALKLSLQNVGVFVTCANDGYEALENIKKKKYDVVITDIVMPKMNGKELYEEAKKIDKSIEFIFLSGYLADFISENYNIDSDRVLMKPVSPNFLYRKIAEVLKKRGDSV